MKKIAVSSVFILLVAALFPGCDFVKNANPPMAPVTPVDSNIVYRNVLVEDYTGHKCGNCPAAALQLTALHTQYPGKVIPLAVHAGFFAKVSMPLYPTNYQTTEGDAYDLLFGNGAAGNPNGLVNRTGFGTSSFIKLHTAWSSAVATELAKRAIFNIRIHNTFNNSTNQLNTDITVKSLATNTGTYKLVVLLTEDSLISEQLDYSKPTGQQSISNYEFNHVLRGAINSTWGDAIFASGAALNDSVVKSYNSFGINPAFTARRCHVVAYVYDAASSSPTYYEVLESNEAHVVE
jgi:thiol-disulfide isomerase/thioredoxin